MREITESKFTMKLTIKWKITKSFQMSEYERRKYTNDEIEECGVKEERQYRRGDC